MRPVVLCRDGVINRIPTGSVRSPDDWHALPGSIRALARLSFARFNLIVVTNQPDIGEGGLDSGTLMRIHKKMRIETEREGGRIDAILHCPHRPNEDCPCRMPRPGLLLELSRRLEIDLRHIPFLSNSFENARMALGLGMRPLIVDAAAFRNQKTASSGIAVFADLASAVDSLVRVQEPV